VLTSVPPNFFTLRQGMGEMSALESFMLPEKWTRVHQNRLRHMPLVVPNFIVLGQTM